MCRWRIDRRDTGLSLTEITPQGLQRTLVACILPAFALLTVAPLLASALRGLRI